MNLQEAVDKYIRLRALKTEKDQAHKAAMATINNAMDQLEAWLLDQMNQLGIESVRTEAGTAYKTTNTSATVSDWEQTLPFIIENELWSMLERRVSKSAVEEYMQVNGELPPGVSVRTVASVNFRST
jgi:hypothetical protein